MMDFTIVIPFIGRRDLLERCLESLEAGPRVIVVDNTGSTKGQVYAEKYDARYYRQTRNIGVAAAWNIGLNDGSDMTIFCSAATVLGCPADEWLSEYYYAYAFGPGFVVPADIGFHWWGLQRRTVEKVGLFDEQLWAYCQDTDYRRRMRLEGIELVETLKQGVWVQEIAHGARLLGLRGNENDDYFFTKWGCTPGEAGDINNGFPCPFDRC